MHTIVHPPTDTSPMDQDQRRRPTTRRDQVLFSRDKHGQGSGAGGVPADPGERSRLFKRLYSED